MVIRSLVSVHNKGAYKMIKVTLSNYSVIYAETIGEALEKAFKLNQNIRYIE